MSSQAAWPNLHAYCPDLAEWPSRWCYEDRDIDLGRALVEALTPFLLHLLNSGLARSTLRKHRDNLWMLGGDIIRQVQQEPRWRTHAANKLIRSVVDSSGGPLLYPAITETEQDAFDATCRKLSAFIHQTSHS